MNTTQSKTASRYANIEDILSKDYQNIISQLNEICTEYQLTDHSKLNQVRFPWSQTYLTYPQFYATRLWEYPWAIMESRLEPGMRCADVGCGESAFTVFLKKNAKCDVVGFDQDLHNQKNKDNFGVSALYARNSGIPIIESSIDHIECDDNQFDRVYCLSVVEHITDFTIRAKGMREISRILKPGGLALISVDINLMMRLANPLELVWESGLNFFGGIDLTMPEKRLGLFCDERQPADVFGIVLKKDTSLIDTGYGNDSLKVEAWRASYLRETFLSHTLEPLLHNDLSRFSKNGKQTFLTRLLIAGKFLLGKYNRYLDK